MASDPCTHAGAPSSREGCVGWAPRAGCPCGPVLVSKHHRGKALRAGQPGARSQARERGWLNTEDEILHRLDFLERSEAADSGSNVWRSQGVIQEAISWRSRCDCLGARESEIGEARSRAVNRR